MCWHEIISSDHHIVVSSYHHIVVSSYSSPYHHIKCKSHLGHTWNSIRRHLVNVWDQFDSPGQGRPRVEGEWRDTSISSLRCLLQFPEHFSLVWQKRFEQSSWILDSSLLIWQALVGVDWPLGAEYGVWRWIWSLALNMKFGAEYGVWRWIPSLALNSEFGAEWKFGAESQSLALNSEFGAEFRVWRWIQSLALNIKDLWGTYKWLISGNGTYKSPRRP